MMMHTLANFGSHVLSLYNECNIVFYSEQLNESLKQMDCKYNEVRISSILLNLQCIWPVWAILKVFA